MPKALQPARKADKPAEAVTHEIIDGTTPINAHVAKFRESIAKLRREAESIEIFLNSPNVTDGPLMDKPVEEMASRANAIRNALKNIDELNVGSKDFEDKLDAILNGVPFDRN